MKSDFEFFGNWGFFFSLFFGEEKFKTSHADECAASWEPAARLSECTRHEKSKESGFKQVDSDRERKYVKEGKEA